MWEGNHQYLKSVIKIINYTENNTSILQASHRNA